MRLARVHDERGATLVFVAVSMVVLLGAAALSVDFGSSFSKRRSVVNANDSAALAFAIWCATGKGDATPDDSADNTAKANASDAVRKPGSPANWTVTGKCMPGAGDNHGSVTVNYQGEANQVFRPILGMSDSQTVGAQATAAWGPAGGAGGVLPAALSMGKLSTCDIPGTGAGTECWFYIDNNALGNATWALMNVQPDCGDGKYGWNVSHDVCPSKVRTPDPTYAPCPSFSAAELRAIITNGSPALTVRYPLPTYVCTVPGAKTTDYAEIKALEGQTRLFPVNDQSKQIKSGGIPCVWPTCVPDFYDIVGFIEMNILNVWRGTDSGWSSSCPGLKQANAWCLHAEWVSFTTEPGPICDECQNFGVESVELRG